MSGLSFLFLDEPVFTSRRSGFCQPGFRPASRSKFIGSFRLDKANTKVYAGDEAIVRLRVEGGAVWRTAQTARKFPLLTVNFA